MTGIVKTIGKAFLWMVVGFAVFVSTPLAYYYSTPLLEPAIPKKPTLSFCCPAAGSTTIGLPLTRRKGC